MPYEPKNKWTEEEDVVLYHTTPQDTFLLSNRDNGVGGESRLSSSHLEAAQKDISTVSIG